MIIYAVLDLQAGLVVRGVRGERERYRPVVSRLVDSAEPIAVARAFRGHLGIDRIYVADLDALGGAPVASTILRELGTAGFHLLVDAGVRSAADAARLIELGAAEAIAPLETLPGPDSLQEIVETLGPERVVFSLDLKHGKPLSAASAWPQATAFDIAREAYRRGARRILLLDLARVGSGEGPAHLDLLAVLSRELPGVELLSGGGVRSAADLRALERAGIRAVLLASSLHDGAITSREISGSST